MYRLIERAKEGDREILVDVFLRFKKTIKKLSKKLRYEEAETDLTIAFLVIIKEINLRRFNSKDDGAIVKYIYRCLKNEFADLYKKNKRKLESTYTFENKIDTIADSRHEDINSRLFVSMLLNSLPPMQRKIIVKRFVQGFSDSEIAFSFKITRQAVNRVKNRALKKLRKIIEKMEGKQWKTILLS